MVKRTPRVWIVSEQTFLSSPLFGWPRLGTPFPSRGSLLRSQRPRPVETGFRIVLAPANQVSQVTLGVQKDRTCGPDLRKFPIVDFQGVPSSPHRTCWSLRPLIDRCHPQRRLRTFAGRADRARWIWSQCIWPWCSARFRTSRGTWVERPWEVRCSRTRRGTRSGDSDTDVDGLEGQQN